VWDEPIVVFRSNEDDVDRLEKEVKKYFEAK
jgi:hypothetical protein